MSATAPEGCIIYISAMMERLGIEPDGVVVPPLSLRYATAFRLCQSCPSTRVFREWLERTPLRASLPPRFCPNSDIRGRGSMSSMNEASKSRTRVDENSRATTLMKAICGYFFGDPQHARPVVTQAVYPKSPSTRP